MDIVPIKKAGNTTMRQFIDSIEVLCPTGHKIGHFRDVLPSQSLGLVVKKHNTSKSIKSIMNKTRIALPGRNCTGQSARKS